MKFTSNIDIMIHTQTGAVFKIAAGTERDIPDHFSADAIAAGATQVTPTKDQKPSEQEGAAVELQIKEAIDQLVDDGNPENFDARGNPKTSVLTEMVGFKVTAKLRDAAMGA